MLKKIILILFLGILFLFLFFPKKITKEKIEIKVNQTVNQIEEIKETIAPEPTKILESGLSNKHLINVDFVPQAPEKNWDEPWQDACEEAALLTVDFYYKNKTVTPEIIRDDILNMIKFEEKQSFSKDMNISQMATVSSQYLGYQSKIIDNPDFKTLKKYIFQNIPIVVPANGKTLFKENKNFKDGGPYYHNLVIVGYDDTKNQFTTNDVGTRLGHNFKYSYDILMESIHDFPLSGHKEDINNGEKRVLILLK